MKIFKYAIRIVIKNGGGCINIFGSGINADSTRIDGDLDVLRKDLCYFEKIGFDYVELPIYGLDMLINEILCREEAS